MAHVCHVDHIAISWENLDGVVVSKANLALNVLQFIP